jgi:serine/threonine protein kinase
VSIQTLTATDGSRVEFIDDVIVGAGTMKDVYFSPCKNYVVAFYRQPIDEASRHRLEMITGQYKTRIFDGESGDYWKNLFCWPEKIVEHKGLTGIVMPVYRSHFFFQHGSVNNDFLNIKGKEKQGKWFASANNQNRFLDAREKGDWLSYLRISLLIARSVRRLHAAGLAHSDLSYKNVLISPTTGNATIIDVDGLVVPGRYPPDVVGTPDFIAPEVLASSHLAKADPDRILPTILSDRHALSVMIYNYLLLRHPLRGDKVHDIDPHKDELLAMGEKAHFIEHPNKENTIDPETAKASELPWKDTASLPYTITGPYLSQLFEQAFIEGLHQPNKRPTADDWENALVKTVDLVQPCQNKQCGQKWYVFDNSKSPVCPFCKQPYRGSLPVINFYSGRDGTFSPDNHRLMVYSNQSLFMWHINRFVRPNERLTNAQKRRLGYFVFHQNQWYLVNEGLADLVDVNTKEIHRVGAQIKVDDGLQLLMGKENGDRLFHFQMVEGQPF